MNFLFAELLGFWFHFIFTTPSSIKKLKNATFQFQTGFIKPQTEKDKKQNNDLFPLFSKRQNKPVGLTKTLHAFWFFLACFSSYIWLWTDSFTLFQSKRYSFLSVLFQSIGLEDEE